MHHDGGRFHWWPLNPKRAEKRKLFAIWRCRFECQTSSRHAVPLIFRHGAKVTCPLKNGKFIIVIRAINQGAQAKSGKILESALSRVLHQWTKGIEVGRVDQRLRLTIGNGINFNRNFVDEAEMEQVHQEWQILK